MKIPKNQPVVSVTNYHTDPAELLLDVLVEAGYDAYEASTNVNGAVAIVTALSPTWKKCLAALSTGPHEYTHYMIDRARARVDVPPFLAKHLKDKTVVIQDCPAAAVATHWIAAAGVQCIIAGLEDKTPHG